MEIIEFYNKYTIEIITTTCIIFFIFGGKIQAKIAPKLGNLGHYKLDKRDLAHGNLYKNISAVGYAAKNNSLEEELENLRIYFSKNNEYFSHEVKKVYNEIYDRFYSFEAWKGNSDKMKKISEENFINMNKLEKLIISETNYTKYMFHNSIKGHY